MTINFNKSVHNKRVEKFMIKQLQPYWTIYRYGRKCYIMTFQYRIHEVTK